MFAPAIVIEKEKEYEVYFNVTRITAIRDANQEGFCYIVTDGDAYLVKGSAKDLLRSWAPRPTVMIPPGLRKM